MKGVQCYELFGGIALKNHTFSFSFSIMLVLFFFSLICANAFYFHALSLFISFFLFASCTVLLICLFFLIICSHRFFFFNDIFYERAMSSPEK